MSFPTFPSPFGGLPPLGDPSLRDLSRCRRTSRGPKRCTGNLCRQAAPAAEAAAETAPQPPPDEDVADTIQSFGPRRGQPSLSIHPAPMVFASRSC